MNGVPRVDMNGVPRVVMRGIDKRFDASLVLRSVDFSANVGEIHALVGENGAGKSTLMRILAGVLQPDGGEILIDGQRVTSRSPQDARRIGIRAVYQEFSLVPQLDVAENLMLGDLPTVRRGIIDWPETRRRAAAVLERLEFRGLDVRARVDRLSVSQRQMVEIAKALRDDPAVLILDEPSAVLSSAELERLFAVLGWLRERGTTVIYVSHRLEEVFAIADRITVLKDGQLAGVVRTPEIDQPGLVRMMVGRPLSEIYPVRPAPALESAEPALELQGLSGRGFHDVSFDLGPGEILGVFGLVGSGRSEVARAVFGATRASGGRMRLLGAPFSPRSPGDALRAGVVMLSEDRGRDGLVLPESVMDNLSLASFGRISRLTVIRRSRQRALSEREVTDLDVRPPDLRRTVRRMSGGNQQKVVLGKWLMHGARVQILDEPTRGVDVATKVQIYHVIADLAASGMAVLLISSELPEILGMSNRVLVMREGTVVTAFSRAEATEERLLAAAAGVTEVAA